jgi:hypothetical protein
MLKFKKYIALMEADTSAATNTEMAICYQYNMRKFDDHDKALAKAGIDLTKWKKVTPDLITIGQKVAKDMGDRGSHLVHSGSGAATNFYEGGRDNTPKADFTGNNQNYISLKKAGESGGSGAQLMSAKSAEAAGVVKAGILHMENNSKKKVTQDPSFIKAIDILENKMLATAKNDLNVEVAKGKTDFEKWYSTSSSRAIELKKKNKPKDVETHLKAELSIVGATRANKKAEKNLIAGISSIKKSDIDKFKKEYEKDGNWKIGDVTVSANHLTSVDPKKLTDPALKEQITGVIQTAIDSREWKEELENFFSENEELKKWIVYEGGSGLYKFTGESASKKSYTGDQSAVANRILVFDDNGIAKEHDMMKWATANANLVDNVDISYKGSGRSKYIKLGLRAHFESELPLLQEELSKLQSAYMLNEGVFRWIKDKASAFMNKVKDIIKIFYENVIKKFILGIKKIAEKGISHLLESLDIEIVPSVSMKTPSW